VLTFEVRDDAGVVSAGGIGGGVHRKGSGTSAALASGDDPFDEPGGGSTDMVGGGIVRSDSRRSIMGAHRGGTKPTLESVSMQLPNQALLALPDADWAQEIDIGTVDTHHYLVFTFAVGKSQCCC
jgi:hypothetical protein